MIIPLRLYLNIPKIESILCDDLLKSTQYSVKYV